MTELQNQTTWHAGQRRRIVRCLDKISNWPPFLKALVGGKLVSISDAVDSLQGRPRGGSNHTVISEMLGALEDSIDEMDVSPRGAHDGETVA